MIHALASSRPILFETFHCRLVIFFTGTAMSCQRRSHGFKGDLREMFNEPNTKKHQENTWLQGKEFSKKEHGQPRTIKHLLKSKMMAHNVGNGESFFHSFGPCFLGPPYLSHQKVVQDWHPKTEPQHNVLACTAPVQTMLKQCSDQWQRQKSVVLVKALGLRDFGHTPLSPSTHFRVKR